MVPSKNILLLSFLYFVQGIPYGLQSRFLPVYLRSSGMSLTNLTFFKLLLIPWLCKALWAPFIDKYGTKREWLIWSMAGLAMTCAFASYLSQAELIALSILLFLLNCFTATQDIAVDSIAIQILSSNQLGQGNTAQVVGYKFGAIIGGGVLLWLVDIIGLKLLFTMLTLIYFLSVLFVFSSQSLKDASAFTKANSNAGQTEKDSGMQEMKVLQVQDMSYFGILRDVLKPQGTKWLLGFVLIYKLGEQGALSSFPLYMVDQNVSSADIGFWVGVLGQITSIFGSALAGFLLSKCHVAAHSFLQHLFLLQLIPLTSMFLLVSFWRPSFFFLGVICMNALLIISGLVTTTTFTFMMQCSQHAPVQIQGTHYTTLATLEVFGKLTFASLLGLLIDLFGYKSMYLFFIFMSVVINPYLKQCPNFLKEIHELNTKSDNKSR
ncbi:major facilitator superfamily domain-containing protein 3-like [Lineus longissimus]|uniref:major facilitator superfamily domain-containing protein 3-like n=1 Tax=Lineus longissimus TaxID=88925 RepID=UPI00315C5A88